MSGTRLAILTGAAGHIGRAAVEKFVATGWSLVITDVSAAVKEVASTAAGNHGTTVIGVQADIAAEEGVMEVTAAAERIGVPVTFLGLIAGINHEAAPVDQIDMNVWDRVLSINLRANVLMMKHCVPLLRKSGGGAIATTSSWWGRAAHPYFSAYCASKAGVIALTQSAAGELAPHIRVNSVAPGNVGTPMHYDALEVEARERRIPVAEMQEIEWAKIPLGRPAEPAEIAAAFHFLASPESSYLTGAVLDVNGGCGFY
jgi:NAD(P)-dependent dehydrogenase (short-subunit alcohol dehydrogenase family)